MTYLHMLNCLSLTFGAPVITYRCTSLPDYNAYPALVSCFFIYSLMAICKLFLLSNLPNFIIESSYYDEFFKILFSVILTPFAILQCFDRISVLSRMPINSRILCVGLGFSFAHSLTHYLVPLWQAKQLEFDWQYIHLSLKSNLYLFLYIAITGVLFNFKESNLDEISKATKFDSKVQGSNKGNKGNKSKSKSKIDIDNKKNVSFSTSIGQSFYFLNDATVLMILIAALGYESIISIMSNLITLPPFLLFVFEASMTATVVYLSYLMVGSKLFKVE